MRLRSAAASKGVTSPSRSARSAAIAAPWRTSFVSRFPATWNVQWSAPALGDAGTLRQTRQTAFTVRVVEMQTLNVS
ncbi:hypothetical protein [Streptomyces sp. NPDC056549]|uniref:hypothetical protein n=1 Tax=Streptomyces sp. NPDC056549 TaxID=3345864 RepID=UPI00368DAE5A